MLPGLEVGSAWSSAQMFLMLFSAMLIAMFLVIFISLFSGLDNVTVAHSQHVNETCKTAKDDVIRASFLRLTDHKVSVHVKLWV